MDAYIDVTALGQVLLTSLVAGAGLVACFALGMVGWSAFEGQPGTGPGEGPTVAGKPAGLALAVVCFTIVLAGVAVGIFAILNK